MANKGVQYIPSGMRLSPTSEIGKKSKSPRTKNSAMMNTDFREEKKAPKTICHGRSLPFENYSIKINENAFFDLNTEYFISYLSGKKTVDQERTNLKNDKESQVNKSRQINPKESHKSTTESRRIVSETSPTQPNKVLNKIDKIKLTLKMKGNKKSQNGSMCNCTQCDNLIDCPEWRNRYLHFEPDKTTKKGLPFLKNNTEETINIFKELRNVILHGTLLPKPVLSVDATYLDEDIQLALKEMNCTSAKDMQSYMWSAVPKGLNVFMIGPAKCGKTLAYLPAFCSFCKEKSDRYMELSKFEGPLIIILCPESECFELQNLAETLISSCYDDIKIKALPKEPPPHVNQNECDILITVPSVLEHCLKLGQVQLKRLCHLALEGAHHMLAQGSESKSVGKLCRIINILQADRPHNKNVQIVVSSEKWSADLETLLKKLYITPLVCFEDFLEAAIYSKIEFKKKRLKNSHKVYYLNDVLKTNYMTNKTVVFCNDEDIAKVKEYLDVSGIESIAISNNSTEDEIFENEDMWNSLLIGQFKVLLCTDSVFEKTRNIVSAEWIVHFCLPADWTQFQNRFRCLSANIASPLGVRKTEQYQLYSICSFIMIDEEWIDRIVNFFEILARNSIRNLQL